MLSLFPSLLAFEGFAPFLLRLTLGAVFAYWAYGKLKKHSNSKEIASGILELLIGISLIIGFLTQLSALISIIILAIQLVKKIKEKAFLSNGVNYYLVLLIISVCLLISGAGFIAFDLPL